MSKGKKKSSYTRPSSQLFGYRSARHRFTTQSSFLLSNYPLTTHTHARRVKQISYTPYFCIIKTAFKKLYERILELMGLPVDETLLHSHIQRQIKASFVLQLSSLPVVYPTVHSIFLQEALLPPTPRKANLSFYLNFLVI